MIHAATVRATLRLRTSIRLRPSEPRELAVARAERRLSDECPKHIADCHDPYDEQRGRSPMKRSQLLVLGFQRLFSFARIGVEHAPNHIPSHLMGSLHVREVGD